jgi:hypothetical protein
MTIEDDCLRVSDRATLNKAADRLAAAGAPALPLFAAAAAGVIGLITLDRPGAKWPAREIESIAIPVVVLVGDDPYPHADALGPDGWACARRLKYWAGAAIIHGTGPHPGHYRAAVEAALIKQRIAFIETASVHIDAWEALLKPRPTLTLRPPAVAGLRSSRPR